MHYHYNCYASHLESDRPISFLREQHSRKSPNIIIKEDSSLSVPIALKSHNNALITTQDTIIYFRKNVGVFSIHKNGNIFYKKNTNVTDQDLFRVLLNLPIGYYFMLNKRLVIHASCVSLNETNYLFIGKSGLGKSTLAAQLVLNGYDFVTEDICVINDENGVLTSFPLIKIKNKQIENNLNYKSKYYFESDSKRRHGFLLDDKYFAKKLCTKNLNSLLLTDKKIETKKACPSNFENFNHFLDSVFLPRPLNKNKELASELISKAASFYKKNEFNSFGLDNGYEFRNNEIKASIGFKL